MPTETYSDYQDKFEAQIEKAEALNSIIKGLAEAHDWRSEKEEK